MRNISQELNVHLVLFYIELKVKFLIFGNKKTDMKSALEGRGEDR